MKKFIAALKDYLNGVDENAPNVTEQQKAEKAALRRLIFGAAVLLALNFILLFLPVIKVYQPSYVKTVFGEKIYGGWYTQWAPMVEFIIPAFLPGIFYLYHLSRFFTDIRKKSDKSVFTQISKGTLKKPARFTWLKFAAIANIIILLIIYKSLCGDVRSMEDYGAYCHLTFFAWLNIVCSAALAIVLFMLSNKTKSMFMFVSVEQTGGNAQ